MSSIDFSLNIQTASAIPAANETEDPKVLPPSIFQADWPNDLKPTCWQKICEIAFTIFSIVIFPIGIALLIERLIRNAAIGQVLPASKYAEQRDAIGPDDLCREVWDANRLEMLKDPNVTRAVITTPDGAKLDCMHFRHPELDEKDDTMIYFNGNGGGYEIFDFEEAYREKVNYIRFNYREVGRSKGDISPDGLKLDAHTILEYAVRYITIPPGKILCDGHSLGGFMAAYAASMHQDSNENENCAMLSNTCSFSSLKVVTQNLVSESVGSCFGCVLGAALEWSGWNYDALPYWNKIRGFKWLEYNPDDRLILLDSTLIKALTDQPGFDLNTLRYLKMDVLRNELDPHNRSLNAREQAIRSAWIQEAFRRT